MNPRRDGRRGQKAEGCEESEAVSGLSRNIDAGCGADWHLVAEPEPAISAAAHLSAVLRSPQDSHSWIPTCGTDMLKRQKILLALVSYSGGALSSTALVKLAFLSRHETVLRTDQTFYEFVPYRFGPFSFALYRELAALKQNGYLSASEDHAVIPRDSQAMSQEKIGELPEVIRWETQEIARRYASFPQGKLLKEVYAKYPWYATKSELEILEPSEVPKQRTASQAVYTIGYEGKSIDFFFQEMLRSGIMVIVDVRANPVSRKYGFAKRSLSEIGAKLGIGYHHVPELGIPGALRVSLSDYASYQRLFKLYGRTVLNKRHEEISLVAKLMEQQPSALLCMEKNVSFCHRGCLAEAVSGENGLPVVHL